MNAQAPTPATATHPTSMPESAALIGQRLSLPAFHQLAGVMGGYPFVKVVVERGSGLVHFINHRYFEFHADYIAEQIMKVERQVVESDIDNFNRLVYLTPERPYYLGILAYGEKDNAGFFTLETVEIDNMDAAMLQQFFAVVKQLVDPAVPIFFKPANHQQEATVTGIDPAQLPRIYSYELYASRDFVPLNTGVAQGRLRLFTEERYKRERATIKWHDIIVMDRVPDDIPRVAGIINSRHTTPLSHTNVLACGWQVPNAVQIGILERTTAEGLDNAWVTYAVETTATTIGLTPSAPPAALNDRPLWSLHQVSMETPEISNVPIVPLSSLRLSDRRRYGTKAASLGELHWVLDHGSARLTGYYRIPRPPRSDLLPYLAAAIGVPNDDKLHDNAWRYLRRAVTIPRGIALPFALQQEFLQANWQIQQVIGKLKMALELNVKEVDALCLQLQLLIRSTRLSDALRDAIDAQISRYLPGAKSFVVRSSSNAEDLSDFSAAGIYESINHVTTADRIFASIREVWASLVSPRSVRLRQEVGISLDDSYMGVIIQEEVESDLGGVLVTTNPLNPHGDFRNVYINASDRSAVEVVSGKSLPFQYLFNTVEGGGRTMAIGAADHDLDDARKSTLQRLSYCGRLLQAHFSQEYSFSTPADIEWAIAGDRIFILQLRPYAS